MKEILHFCPQKDKEVKLMLSLGRNPGEYVMIGDDIVIQVVSMDGELRLAIDAPKTLPIQRGEVYEQSHDPPKCIRGKYIKHKQCKPQA